MESNSNKRVKMSTGASATSSSSSSSSTAANLPHYMPPAATNNHTARGVSRPGSRPSASVARPANGKTSLRLTVKAPPSKLRQATSGIPPNPYADEASESDATPAPSNRTARSTRNPVTVVEPESDEEGEGDEDGDEVMGEDGDEEEDDDEEDEDDDQDEEQDDDDEGDEEDAEGDEDEEMEDELHGSHPPPPVIRQEAAKSKPKPNVTVTAPPEGPVKSVEAKEMEEEDEDDDEELSDLSENENEPDEADEGEDGGEGDSDLDTDDPSRSATPDMTKLTRRQRGVYEEEADPSLLSLSNEAQKKKHLTAEEHNIRRAEMARRRKNLSEKRNEEEKMDTINKLLKKPAPKRRTRAEIIAAQQAEAMAGTPGAEGEGEEERPDALFVRWVQNRAGSRVGVPEEWMEGGAGEVFRAGGRVQEVA